MGTFRSRMSSLKLAIIPLALCLIFTLRSHVSGKPRHLLIETKEKGTNDDYQNDYHLNNGADYQNDYHMNNENQIFQRKGDDYALDTNDYHYRSPGASDYNGVGIPSCC